jgi:hypothetical protein
MVRACVPPPSLPPPGIFGMNLNSHVQEDDNWFKNVVIAICVGIVVCVGIAFSLLQMFLRT